MQHCIGYSIVQDITDKVSEAAVHNDAMSFARFKSWYCLTSAYDNVMCCVVHAMEWSPPQFVSDPVTSRRFVEHFVSQSAMVDQMERGKAAHWYRMGQTKLCVYAWPSPQELERRALIDDQDELNRLTNDATVLLFTEEALADMQEARNRLSRALRMIPAQIPLNPNPKADPRGDVDDMA